MRRPDRALSTLLLVAGVLAPTAAVAQSPDAPASRRVYVLHAGVHSVFSPSDPNGAAERLRSGLRERGIPDRDLLVLDSPFPAASWRDVLPKAGVVMYLQATDPSAAVAQDAYRRLDQALARRGVTARDEIVWVGHSAGGQLGMALAHLAHHLPKYPALARDARPYRFGMVMTLGSGIGANPVPSEVALRHYHSPADRVVRLLLNHGQRISAYYGVPVGFQACHEPGPNCVVRSFEGIDHHLWTREPRVLDRIVAELLPAYRAPWRRPHAELPSGAGLAQLCAEAIEGRASIDLESTPRSLSKKPISH